MNQYGVSRYACDNGHVLDDENARIREHVPGKGRKPNIIVECRVCDRLEKKKARMSAKSDTDSRF